MLQAQLKKILEQIEELELLICCLRSELNDHEVIDGPAKYEELQKALTERAELVKEMQVL